jgi:hypothetical protein
MLGSDIGIADIKFPGGPKLVNSFFNNYIGETYRANSKEENMKLRTIKPNNILLDRYSIYTSSPLDNLLN